VPLKHLNKLWKRKRSNSSIAGDAEVGLASIDNRPPMSARSASNRKLSTSPPGTLLGNGRSARSDPPGDMMAKLSLSEEAAEHKLILLGGASGTSELPAAVENAVNGRIDNMAVADAALEVQYPDNNDGIGVIYSPNNRGGGAGRSQMIVDAANVDASKALQSLQASAAASSSGKKSDSRRDAQQQQGAKGIENPEELVEEEEEEEESSEDSASDEDGSWISWFCSLRGNEFFCEVDEDYIQDDFNLTGLNVLVPYYDYALDMVLDVEMPMEDSLTEEQQEIVESAAEMLYGLIHARYIVTNRGMHAMYEKYRTAAFGRCPHVFCQGQPVLPVGLSDLPRNYTVNVFCPRCHGLFFPKSTRQANIDGAYFGTTFPHLYLMTHPDMIPAKPTQTYSPRVYGFKVHSSSLYYKNREENPIQQQADTSQRQNRRSRHRHGRK